MLIFIPLFFFFFFFSFLTLNKIINETYVCPLEANIKQEHCLPLTTHSQVWRSERASLPCTHPPGLLMSFDWWHQQWHGSTHIGMLRLWEQNKQLLFHYTHKIPNDYRTYYSDGEYKWDRERRERKNSNLKAHFTRDEGKWQGGGSGSGDTRSSQ